MKKISLLGLFAVTGLVHAGAADFPAAPSVYTHYTADNPNNLTSAPLAQTFLPADVDVEHHRLMLPNIGFAAIVYPNGIGPATPVYFASSGKLPAPLEPDKPYYVIPAPGGGYQVFAVAVDEDAPLQPGGILGERVLPAQNVSQGVNPIVFKDGGTGTHTLSTKTLIEQFTDLTPNGYNSVSVGGADKQAMLEIDTDAEGRKFVRTGGATARENFVGSYSTYGQGFVQAPSTKRLEARERVGGKRVVYQIFVCKVRSFHERQVMKAMLEPANVAPDKDQITYAADHRMTGKYATGDLVNLKAYPGTALPAPLAEGTDYYARKVDNKNISLHPTAADAAANTNAIDLTTSGSGSFLLSDPERVGDSRRWSFFAEVLAPHDGGNTLSSRLQEPLPTVASILKNATGFTVSGANNGNITGLGAAKELLPVVLWTPPRATLPPPLRAGVKYWVTKAPGGKEGRLHESLASARESVGVPTDKSSCIKFTAAGRGETLVSYDDDASPIGLGTLGGTYEPFAHRVPLGPLCILVFKIDFDDPAAEWALTTLGVNEAITEQKPVLKLAKALTPEAIKDGAPAWRLFNSAQGHVPIDMDFYEAVFGSSTEAVPDAEIQGMVDYLKKKYGITN